MMKSSKVRVSLVIPAYNEAAHLRACLDKVAAQTARPFEVIVVDNNSTDQTAAVACSYPFVRVVFEKRRGLAHARNAGFNAARGDVIGRIDVDSLLPLNWIDRVQQIFANQEVDAVSGALGFHDAPFRRFFQQVDLLFRRYLARNLGRQGELFLYGSNMAVRKTLWQGVRGELCTHPRLHEDMDLAAHLANTKYRVIFDENLRAEVSVRRIDTDMRTFYTYVLANPRTYAFHGLASRLYMYPVVWIVLIFYLPLRILYRAYDPRIHRFSWSHLRRPSYRQRTSPISESV